MNKDPKIFLEHILQSIESIEDYTHNLTKEDFFNSTLIQDAVIRRIEIIGDAIKNLPITVKDKFTEVPWRDIAGMRDIPILKDQILKINNEL